jgi:hypothetical protein
MAWRARTCHVSEEFQSTTPNTATSTSGFSVQWIPHGGVLYQDAAGQVRIDSELLVKPSLGILLYPGSGGLRNMSKSQSEMVLSNVKKALEYLGHRVEIWSTE